MRIFNYRSFLSFILVFWTSTFYAQNVSKDTIITLSTFNISSERLYGFTGGQKFINLDTLVLKQYVFQNVSDLVMQQTLANVKTYGSGMLSNIGIRGNASQNTGVFWNGIDINASNIGMTDFSLLPVYFFDKVDIQYGGGSALFGSGSIGGSFHFFSEPVFKKKINISLSGSKASFNDVSTATKIILANTRFYSATSFFYKKADNDFEYINEAKYLNPLEKMMNAGVLSKGLLQDFAFKINKLQKITFSTWLQDNKRQIPGTMTTGISKAVQYDQTVRSVINWDRTTEKNKIYFKIAGIIEDQHFIDSIIDVDSRIKITNQIAEIGFSKKIKSNIKIDGGINNTLSLADIQSYNGIKKQNKTSVFLSYNHFIKPTDWSVQLNARYEIISGFKIPICPSLGLDGKIWKFLYGKVSISKNFRVPTLNDIYWQPGGNPNLKSEESYNGEATIIAKYNGKGIIENAELSATAYHSIIDNCIQWLPTQYIYWTPQNLRKVRSEGIEIEGKCNFKMNKFKFILNSAYAYTSIINLNQISVFDESYYKQLIYVPFNKFLFNINGQYKNAYISYNQVYTGKRFTSTDNLKSLSYYNLGMLSFSYAFQFSKIRIESSFKIDNIWDTKYQIIQWRPMPGRNYRVGLNFNFNSNK